MSPTRIPNHASRRRLMVLCFGLVMLLVLVLAPSALANVITPESGAGSPNADSIDTLYKIVLGIAIVIFIVVEGALVYALVHFRASKGHEPVQTHGNTRLEIGWTLGAAALLIVLAIVTFVKIGSIRDPAQSGPGLDLNPGVTLPVASEQQPPPGRSLHILVNGQQYIWRYTYPYGTNPDGLDRPYSYELMVVPTNTTVTLDITSQDVVHSWWVPALGGKFDAVPGYVNHTWFKITKPGIYRGQCAFICGRGHARMIATVEAVSPAQYVAWIQQRETDLAAADAAAAVSRAKLNAQTGPQSVENP